MVKFDGSDDGDYGRVAKYLSGLAKEANAKVKENWAREKYCISP
jgi:hypothetical protein